MLKSELFGILSASLTTPVNKLALYPFPTSEGVVYGKVMGIEREDGSGKCFNVRIQPAGERNSRTIFIRTID